MGLPLARPRPQAMVASGYKVRPDEVGRQRRLEQPWQNEALVFYNLLGEVRFASHFYARMLQRLRIFPALRVDDDRIEPIESGPPVDALNRIQDPGGGRTAILKGYGRLMFITGEGYLFGLGLSGGQERWSFVWRDELRFDDMGAVTHMLAPLVPVADYRLVDDDDYEELAPGDAVAYRMWTPHPQASMLPDSPMLSTLGICKELVTLTQSVNAIATSRMVRSKILAMPLEFSPGSVFPGRSEDPLNDPFQADLAEHFEAALEDPSHAAALSPYVIWGQAQYIEKIRDFSMHNSETDYLERDLRIEAVKRLALGWDMPPEALLGLADSNHWSAWAVREDMWVQHGAPMAEQFCDDLGEAYLRPALREAEYDGWEEVVVGYDETAVVVNPDRSKDADEAWDRGAISYKAYRNAKRFKESDAQDEEEHAEWLLFKTRGAVVTNGDEPEPERGPPPGEPGPVSEQTNLPTNGSARMSKPRVVNDSDRLMILGAAQMAMHRCRELAGARLRSRRDTCPDCLQAAASLPNSMVATVLDPDTLTRLGAADAAELVSGGADGFRRMLRTWGFSEAVVDPLARQIEEQSASTLREEQPTLELVG